MLSKYLSKILRTYKVVKTKTDEGPIPSMIQYWLQNDKGQTLSFWNDIPFNLQNDVVNCVVQIPKQKHGKFEVKKHIVNHPIMQDTRKNVFTNELELRFYSQFPLFNYGFIPQTWQQNIVKDKLGHFGDDDPIDICDLSQKEKKCGDIFRGKVLGGFCLIDQGEIDWKILVMDQQQCKTNNVHKIQDVNPRRIESIKNWFKIVKVFDGKKPNHIAYDEKVFNKEQTLKNILQTRQSWIDLMKNQSAQVADIRKKHRISKRHTQIQK